MNQGDEHKHSKEELDEVDLEATKHAERRAQNSRDGLSDPEDAIFCVEWSSAENAGTGSREKTVLLYPSYIVVYEEYLSYTEEKGRLRLDKTEAGFKRFDVSPQAVEKIRSILEGLRDLRKYVLTCDASKSFVSREFNLSCVGLSEIPREKEIWSILNEDVGVIVAARVVEDFGLLVTSLDKDLLLERDDNWKRPVDCEIPDWASASYPDEMFDEMIERILELDVESDHDN